MNQKPFHVVIGYDPGEHAAAQVAAASLRRVTNGEVDPIFLCQPQMRAQGLYTRPEVFRDGQWFDLKSNAPVSTQFSLTRFLTPVLCHTGFALFVDCDVVFEEDPRRMLVEIQPGKAVYVVQHQHAGTEPSKMMGLKQTSYPRKNWSSVMLFDCDHNANARLSVERVNQSPGAALHRLGWLDDFEIGALAPRWNWLVDVQPRPAPGGIAHLTLGGPWFDGWGGGAYDAQWQAEYALLGSE